MGRFEVRAEISGRCRPRQSAPGGHDEAPAELLLPPRQFARVAGSQRQEFTSGLRQRRNSYPHGRSQVSVRSRNRVASLIFWVGGDLVVFPKSLGTRRAWKYAVKTWPSAKVASQG
jgi:hypothetical protein